MTARKKANQIFKYFKDRLYYPIEEERDKIAKEMSLYMVEELIIESNDGCWECGGGEVFGKDFWIKVKCELNQK